MHYSLPDMLTLLRIALIPIFVACYYLPFEWSVSLSAFIFALAAITDLLDGYLARRLEIETEFGAFLDPVADKLMVITALVVIVSDNPTPYPSIWLAVTAIIIIGREITISALREWMAELGNRAQLSVNLLGKLKTTVQMVALLLLLYQNPIGVIPTIHVGFILLNVSALLTLWSMFRYLTLAWPFIRNKGSIRG